MHSFSQIYLPRLQSYQNELLQRLEILVNIDSGSGQIDGVNAIISHLEQWFRDIGFTVTLHNSTPYGNNLVARKTGKGHLRLLLVGHVDTVYPQGAACSETISYTRWHSVRSGRNRYEVRRCNGLVRTPGSSRIWL